MAASVKQQIVHESEAQRQHVRLPLPAVAVIDGKSYETKDLSSGGVSVLNITGNFSAGDKIPLHIKLPFAGFSLDLGIDAEILHYDASNKSLGCRFIELGTEQLSLINHALKAFMAGDIVAFGDVLNVSSRDNFVKARKSVSPGAEVPFDLKRQLPGLAVIGLIGLVAAFFIVSNIYESVFVLKTPVAYVSGPAIEARAASEGLFKSALAADTVTVKPGQTIGSVQTGTGLNTATTAIQSTCDCLLVQKFRHDGEFVGAGEKVLSMIPVDATPWIIATVSPVEAEKLSINNKTTIGIAGSRTEFTGRVVDIRMGEAVPAFAGNQPAQPSVQVKIVPDQKLPIDLMGRPARVSFSL